MSLQVRRKAPITVRTITTLVALFALVAQPMYGLVASQVANAALPDYAAVGEGSSHVSHVTYSKESDGATFTTNFQLNSQGHIIDSQAAELEANLSGQTGSSATSNLAVVDVFLRRPNMTITAYNIKKTNDPNYDYTYDVFELGVWPGDTSEGVGLWATVAKKVDGNWVPVESHTDTYELGWFNSTADEPAAPNMTQTVSINVVNNSQKPAPAFTNVSAQLHDNIGANTNAETFRGITVNFSYENLKEVAGITGTVHRAGGDDVVKVAKATAIAYGNTLLNDPNHGNSLSMPIVIEEGTYDEQASQAWEPATASWIATTIPESVTVRIDFTDGDFIEENVPVSSNGLDYSSLLPDVSVAPSVPKMIFPADGKVLNSKNLYIAWEESTDNQTSSDNIKYEYRLYLSDSKALADTNGTDKSLQRFAQDYTGSTRHPSAGFAGATKEDTYFWKVRACDQVGSCSEWSEVRGFTIDNTAPEASTVILNKDDVTASTTTGNCEVPSQFYTVNGTINFSANFNDTLSDMKNVKYRVQEILSNGCSKSSTLSLGYVNMTNDGGVQAGELDTTVIKDETKTYSIHIVGEDEAGNTAERNIGFVVDNTGPNFEVTERPIGGIFNEADIVFKGTASSEQGGVGLLENSNGEYVYATVTDLDDEDGEDDSRTFHMTVTDGQWVLNSATKAVKSQEYITLGDYLVDGREYKVTFKALDKLKNQTIDKAAFFTIDNTAPATPVVISGMDKSAATDRVITGTAEVGSTVSVLLTSGLWQSVAEPVIAEDGTWSVVFTGLNQGVYQVIATATDAANNTSTAGTASFEVYPTINAGLNMLRGVPLVEDDPLEDQFNTDAQNSFAAVFTLPGETVTTEDQSREAAVAGAQTERDSADSSEQFAAVPTEDGWKIFGLMWYWWLLIVAAVAGVAWLIAGARRRAQDDVAL